MPEIGLGVLSCDLNSVIRARGWPGGERRGERERVQRGSSDHGSMKG